MKLEDWIKKDIKRYVKEHEPATSSEAPVHSEDYGVIAKIDYERHIKRSLDQGRFKEATKQFNDLKEYFLHIPPEHQQERKQYYRVLQKSYKHIYDWVEDRHKTHRLLDRLDDKQDVFDQQIKPTNLNKSMTQPQNAPKSIEEQMFKHPHKPQKKKKKAKKKPTLELPSFDEHKGYPEMPSIEESVHEKQPAPRKKPQKADFEELKNQFRTVHKTPEETNQQQPKQTTTKKPTNSPKPAPRKKPATKQQETRKPTPTPARNKETNKTDFNKLKNAFKEQPPAPKWKPPTYTKPPARKPKKHAPHTTALSQLRETSTHAPKWKPPRKHQPPSKQDLDFEEIKNRFAHKQPSKAPNQPTNEPHNPSPQILEIATHELLQKARTHLRANNYQAAKTALIEARFEALRTNNKHLQEETRKLEARLQQKKPANKHEFKDAELFSSLYLQGMHALKAGDYQAAANLFKKRIHQAPNDHAAKIRYHQCEEAIQ